jgi:glycosyltransferase involved in cell wall biosynthesis
VAIESSVAILHVFSTFAIGGPQRRFAALVNHFGARFQHIVIAMDGCTDAQALLEHNNTCEVRPLGFERRGMLENIRRARAVLKRVRPRALFTYNWGAIEWAAANIPRLAPHVHIEDGFGPEEAAGQLPRRVWFRRLVLNRQTTVVLPSQTLVRLARDAWRLNQKRMIYLPNGIPCDRFGGLPDPTLTSGFRGTGPVIGTIATLRREKALDRLIAAFAAVRATRPCRLVIVGGGPERSALERAAAEAGVANDVTFTGNLDRPERILGGFDVFAVSSDTEQMPLSILEAMAAGLAIATTDAGDIREMVAAENGPFVVPKTTEALAGALSALLADPELREGLGAANRARAQAAFDEPAMMEAYGCLFEGRPGLISSPQT